MKSILIISFALLLHSCNRDSEPNYPDVSINGQVKNRITGLPIANARIKFEECENPYMYSPTCRSIEYVYTDSNGVFSCNFKYKSNLNYYCLFNENYYMHTDTSYGIINTSELNGNSLQNINLSVLPYSKLRLKIDNIACYDSNDNFELYQTNQIQNYNEFSDPLNLDGCANYENPVFDEIPMGYNYFHWIVTKNGVTQNFYDTLYLEQWTDTLYQINY